MYLLTYLYFFLQRIFLTTLPIENLLILLPFVFQIDERDLKASQFDFSLYGTAVDIVAKNVWAKMFGRKYPEKVTSQITATICGTPLPKSIGSHSKAPKEVTNHTTKWFVIYGVTFDLCKFCTFLNSAQLAGWAKFKNVQNLHKLNVTP